MADFKEKIKVVDGIEYEITTPGGRKITGWVRCPFTDRLFRLPRLVHLCVFVPLVAVHVLFSRIF